MTFVERRQRPDNRGALIRYALALKDEPMTLATCSHCGEYEALHAHPCVPGECVNKDCHELIVDSELGVCGSHLALVKSQRSTRYHPVRRGRGVDGVPGV